MKRQKSQLEISDHALIRYIERVLEVDLDPVRKQLMDKVLPSYAGMSRQAVVKGGFRYILADGKIATVIPDDNDSSGMRLFRKEHGHNR